MKHLIILLLVCIASIAGAQQRPIGDPSLKFDQRVSRCEKKWIIMPKADTASRYHYGYVYMDLEAGLTFDWQGTFTVDANGKYIADKRANPYAMVKHRLQPGWAPAALLPPAHFDELKIKADPDQFKIYYPAVNDSLYHNFRRGFNYNAAYDGEMALIHLNKVYKKDPQYKGLIFEMAYAYNALDRSTDAIALIEPAIKKDPANIYYYKELGFAFMRSKQFEKAIATYKDGLAQCKDERSDVKGELAANTADAYKGLGNKEEFTNWILKAKAYSPEGSNLYRRIVAAGF